MNSIRVYLYDSTQEANGYRGTDFSANVLQGSGETEDITQELDTAEITLAGLSFYKEFDPETKFVVDIVSEEDGTENITTVHLCVSRDTVMQPILSDDNYFDHHISFIEPSVVAQKRLVDNISATYKLKDVTLEEKPGFPEVTVGVQQDTTREYPPYTFGGQTISLTSTPTADLTGRTVYTEKAAYTGGEYFSFDGTLKIKNGSGVESGFKYNDIANFGTPKEGETLVTEGTATFIIPKMRIHRGGRDGQHKTYIVLGYASIDVTITEHDANDPNTITGTWTETFISNSDLGTDNDLGPGQTGEHNFLNILNGEWLLEEIGKTSGVYSTPKYYYKRYTDKTATEPTYEMTIPIKVDKQYSVTISLHQFDDTPPSGGLIDSSRPSLGVWRNLYTGESPSFWEYSIITVQYYDTSPSEYFNRQVSELKKKSMTSSNTTGTGSFIFYNADTKTIVYSQSTPYSALALLQKAILNSSTYEKIDGVYIADVNKSEMPFYIDTQFQDELASTQIIENFYSQKNLWEICLEVGHYIHAIPRIEFGADDRFLITFDELGRTDKKTDTESTKVSIYNSRSVENYISATSSYVTNMVQLGGTISEWVTPKTTDEQLLVYNDTAEIIVSKPIIELLKVTARCNVSDYDGIELNQEADLTPFIFEENVYKILNIDYTVIPNRGIAMYYALGDNVIKGGQYQLPQEINNIYTDYAFKKILYSAYNGYPVLTPIPETGYWRNYTISDFSFNIVYRTKDGVRQNHIRPDLRKYLLNSQYDKIPEHNQFNNQTDIVVDSVSFGNNVYGTLIKTGNSSYETVEWNSDYTKVKHKGELYKIRGDLYYVAKVTHYHYSSYILSKVTFSKDYNELSPVIGIPSEPRFYEISEQSAISREKAINDILLLTDDLSQLSYGSNYVFDNGHLSRLILGTGTDFARYALTVFKGDKDVSAYDQTIGEPNFYKEVLSPINAYSSENTLTYEWDMVDNYSAGDKVITTTKKAYNSLWAVSYTDIYGKSALFDFYILGDIGTLTASAIKALPESPICTKKPITTVSDGTTTYSDTRPFIGSYNILATNVGKYDENFNGRGIGLLKDCREKISINYNLQLATSSDTFVVSPFVFLPTKKSVSIVLLSEEVNKITNGYIPISAIIQPLDDSGAKTDKYFDFSIISDTITNEWESDYSKSVSTYFGIDLSTVLASVSAKHFEDNTENYARVKSIAVLCSVPLNPAEDTGTSDIPYKSQFIIARNIPSDWDKAKAVSPIYFGSPNKDTIFTNKQ